ncbi:helix-turn-helix transcriptional regulator [Pedobacter aquae]|uniref:Helix-turn-helix transcriptional regulator n=1 Tax=Pedobacter aquae TaxID=2605747 RepID=A0A5C0VGX1_9SPHI|nr:helix-turn-helix transcriptional regulator [Pedobacter aquae]QEK51123.1 helix-turn-helix transcriptional regulator [Pedobacter aquae]
MENNIISNWLKENGDPSIRKATEINLAIATKINNILQAKSLKAVDLAVKLNKNQSEVSKWLTGMHTFTTKTLAKISLALEEEIIFTEPKTKNIYFTVYKNENVNDGTEYETSEILASSIDLDRKIS